jgi:hypothetical protein
MVNSETAFMLGRAVGTIKDLLNLVYNLAPEEDYAELYEFTQRTQNAEQTAQALINFTQGEQ